MGAEANMEQQKQKISRVKTTGFDSDSDNSGQDLENLEDISDDEMEEISEGEAEDDNGGGKDSEESGEEDDDEKSEVDSEDELRLTSTDDGSGKDYDTEDEEKRRRR